MMRVTKGGDAIYGDFDLDPATESPIELRSFEPGIGTFGWMAGSPDRVPDPDSVQYYHTDMIGTLRNMTDSTGSPGTLRVLTAFGESIAGPGIHGAPGRPDRYGYAGEWGYQTDTVADPARRFAFLHVGARYYDPSSGRFLQRDPIAISGGLNVYAYVQNGPTIRIDPDGLQQFDVGACVGYCQGRKAGCVAGADGKSDLIKCNSKYKACETCCGNADIESQMGDDKGPPPYGPPPATFDPYPSSCGCTGIEAFIVLLPLFWKQRKNRKVENLTLQ